MKSEQLALSEIQRLINPAATAIAPIRSLPNGWQSIFTAEGRSFLVQCRGDSYQVLAVPPGIVERSDRNAPSAATKAECGRGWQGFKPGCVRSKSGKSNAKTETGTNKTRSLKVAKPTNLKPSTPQPGSIAEVSPNDIEVDPKRFQYKIIGEHTKTGEVGSLSGVQRYDPNLSGMLQVWRDPADGKTYVVNGHNRLALAKRLGADKVAVRYLDVKDPKEARSVGAMTNIAEGRGTALDAAKFFKDSGITREQLEEKGIPMREKIATDGIALSKLEDSLFRKVIDGDIPTERGAIIGGSDLSSAKQRDLYELSEKQAKKGRKLTNDVLSELVDTVKGADQSSETQFDLFGASEVQQTNAIERASLQASLKKKLGRDKKLFGIVGKSKAAQDLARAGNIIDVESSSKISGEAAATLNIFDKLKNTRGGVSDAVNEAATRIKNGENKKTVESELYDRIKQAIKQETGGANASK